MRLNRFPLQYVFGVLCIVWLFVSSSAYSGFVANFIRGVGVAFVIVGVYGRLYATIFIGGMKNEGVDGKSFIDYGAYSLCRNPLYLFSFIAFVGVLALKGQIALIIIGALIYLWIYRMTILSEEEFLESKFGEPYKQFLQKTSRFFPRLKGFHCPEKIEVRPEFLHKEIRRALNWFLGVVAILAIEVLQYYEILPVFWRIY
ncbi:methyltransferase family protein [Helicobacter himalayensis]|uniref:methyltransferase family protein n=1 Tax=Helicobacter himalayensis TaxID=1591088 RepID=UPI003D6DEC86